MNTQKGPILMSVSDGQPVTVCRRIEAVPEVVFAILTDPAMHPVLDGSGMVRASVSAAAITQVGDTFTMRMHNEEMGDYEITNHVVEFVPARRIGWEPVLTDASRDEDSKGIGDRNHHVWAFELSPLGNNATEVTESYDCTRSPDWLRGAVKHGERWRESMNLTLEKLDRVATGGPS